MYLGAMRTCAFFGFLFWASNGHASVNAAAEVGLPSSGQIATDIGFWEKIFSKYEANECVFHDSWNLNVIYGIKRIKPGTRRSEEDQVEQQRKSIRNALVRFSLGKKPYGKVEKQVFKAIPPALRTGAFFTEAKDAIRCQRGIASSFQQSLERSKKHLPMIRKMFKHYGLPEDLAYLPHLESGFHERAHSKAGARGLWQLMPGKAREHRLRVNGRFDDRLSPWAATKVAAKILLFNFQKTGSWPLALTGYNYGINGISRGIQNLGTTDFEKFRREHRSPIFGFAARNFYTSFLAVRNIAKRFHGEKIEQAKVSDPFLRIKLADLHQPSMVSAR